MDDLDSLDDIEYSNNNVKEEPMSREEFDALADPLSRESMRNTIKMMIGMMTRRDFVIIYMIVINILTVFNFMFILLLERYVTGERKKGDGLFGDSRDGKTILSDAEAQKIIDSMRAKKNGGIVEKRISYKDTDQELRKKKAEEEKRLMKGGESEITKKPGPFKGFCIMAIRRLSEASVMTIALMGGTPTALMLCKRHPRKKNFTFQLNLILMAQLLFIAYILWKAPVDFV